MNRSSALAVALAAVCMSVALVGCGAQSATPPPVSKSVPSDVSTVAVGYTAMSTADQGYYGLFDHPVENKQFTPEGQARAVLVLGGALPEADIYAAMGKYVRVTGKLRFDAPPTESAPWIAPDKIEVLPAP